MDGLKIGGHRYGRHPLNKKKVSDRTKGAG